MRPLRLMNPDGRRRWEAVPWVKPGAYTLFGLTPPWETEGGEVDSSFRTSESGQMLFNRRAALRSGKMEWEGR